MEDCTAIAETIVSSIRSGTIIVLHDGRPPREQVGTTLPTREGTADAVPLILNRLTTSGYRFVTVSELFGLAAGP